MTIYRGPILTLAAPHERQRRLANVAHSRITTNVQCANADRLTRRRAAVAGRIERGCNAFVGWLVARVSRRAALVPSFER
jgi:hypothetical protein